MSLLLSVLDSQIAKYGRTGERKRSIRVKTASGATVTARLSVPCASLDDDKIGEAAYLGIKVSRVMPFGNGEAYKAAEDALTAEPASALIGMLAMTEAELRRELKTPEANELAAMESAAAK